MFPYFQFRPVAGLALWVLVILAQGAAAASGPTSTELDAMGTAAISRLTGERPELEEKVAASAGYSVIAVAAAKVPGVGAGQGYGVVVDQRDGSRSYLKVSQIEVGAGLGGKKAKFVILFREASVLERMKTGGWRYESGADVSAADGDATSDTYTSARSGKGYKVFQLNESGAVATITLRLLYGQPYTPAESAGHK